MITTSWIFHSFLRAQIGYLSGMYLSCRIPAPAEPPLPIAWPAEYAMHVYATKKLDKARLIRSEAESPARVKLQPPPILMK